MSGFDPTMLAKASAACIVADRAHAEQLVQLCSEPMFRGAWLESARSFQQLHDMRYVVLLADKPVRFERRAPLLLLARNDEALRLTVEHACSLLSDVICAWLRLLEPVPDTIINQILLADSESGGTA